MHIFTTDRDGRTEVIETKCGFTVYEAIEHAHTLSAEQEIDVDCFGLVHRAPFLSEATRKKETS